MCSTPDPSPLLPEGGSFLKGSPEEAPSFLARSTLPKAGFGDLMAWVVERREAKRQQWQDYKHKRKSQAKPKPISRAKKAQYQRTYRAKINAGRKGLSKWNPNPALAREKKAAEARRHRYKEMLDRKRGIK
jgi:hypothetical protein